MSSRVEFPAGVYCRRRQELVDLGGCVVPLSSREIGLLEYLLARPNRDVMRRDLWRQLWGRKRAMQSRAVDAAISRLRRKLDLPGPKSSVLRNVRGSGYRLVIGEAHPEAIPRSLRRQVTLADVQVELGSGELCRGGSVVATLTELERQVFVAVLGSAGTLLPSQDLARLVWGQTRSDHSALASVVYRLRKKLFQVGLGDVIESIRGQGYRLAITPSSSSEPSLFEEMCWAAARHAGLALGVSDCVIYEVKDDSLIQIACYGPKNPTGRVIDNRLVLRASQGVVGRVASTGRARLVADTLAEPDYVEDSFSGRSELAVPILSRGRVLGVIDTEARPVGAYCERDLVRFQSLAELLGASVLA